MLSHLTLGPPRRIKYRIIALDDFHRPDWPEVSIGIVSWYNDRRNLIVPFAMGFDKLLLPGMAVGTRRRLL